MLSFGGHDAELYFEEDEFDQWLERAEAFDLTYLHPVREHAWGQRVVRFYDPDRHVIEVGENMDAVCQRFLDSGMPPEQVAERMDVPMKFVKRCLRKAGGVEALFQHLAQLHTTELGAARITENLGLMMEDVEEVVRWCAEQISLPEAVISPEGKNWSIETGDCILTVNASSYTIITAHRKKTERHKT